MGLQVAVTRVPWLITSCCVDRGPCSLKRFAVLRTQEQFFIVTDSVFEELEVDDLLELFDRPVFFFVSTLSAFLEHVGDLLAFDLDDLVFEVRSVILEDS